MPVTIAPFWITFHVVVLALLTVAPLHAAHNLFSSTSQALERLITALQTHQWHDRGPHLFVQLVDFLFRRSWIRDECSAGTQAVSLSGYAPAASKMRFVEETFWLLPILQRQHRGQFSVDELDTSSEREFHRSSSTNGGGTTVNSPMMRLQRLGTSSGWNTLVFSISIPARQRHGVYANVNTLRPRAERGCCLNRMSAWHGSHPQYKRRAASLF